MSGGHFNYKQFHIDDIATAIETLIKTNECKTKNFYDEYLGRHYPPHIIAEFEKGAKALKIAAVYAQRIDWLVSGDDGEESFMQRLKEDLGGRDAS